MSQLWSHGINLFKEASKDIWPGWGWKAKVKFLESDPFVPYDGISGEFETDYHREKSDAIRNAMVAGE